MYPSNSNHSKTQYTFTCTINNDTQITCKFLEFHTLIDTYIRNNGYFAIQPLNNLTYNDIPVTSVTNPSLQQIQYSSSPFEEQNTEFFQQLFGLSRFKFYEVYEECSRGNTTEIVPMAPEISKTITNICRASKFGSVVPHNCETDSYNWGIMEVAREVENPDKVSPITNAFKKIVLTNFDIGTRKNIYKEYFDSEDNFPSEYAKTVRDINLPFIDTCTGKDKIIFVNSDKLGKNILIDKVYENKKCSWYNYIELNGCDEFIVPGGINYTNMYKVDLPDMKITNFVELRGYSGLGLNVELWDKLYSECRRLTNDFNYRTCRDDIVPSCNGFVNCGELFGEVNIYSAGMPMDIEDPDFVEVELLDECDEFDDIEEIIEENLRRKNMADSVMMVLSCGLGYVVKVVVEREMFHGWKNGRKYICDCLDKDCSKCKLDFLTLRKVKYGKGVSVRYMGMVW